MEKEINEEAYDLRVNKGMLPTLAIAGHIFYVDINMDKLRPKDDFKSKGINFNEIKDYYDRDRRAYVIPYNPTTHEFQESDVFKLTELPKDTIMVQFPHQYDLDKVGWNKKHGISFSHKDVPQMHHEAQILPWEDTNIIEHIKRNVAEQLLPKKEFISIYTIKDTLFKIPTDATRVLPTHTIQWTEFLVDVNQLELREKNNPQNVISLRDMDEKPINGYEFWYSSKSKGLTTYAEEGANLISIPDFSLLDPIGMAKKYNVAEDKMKEMSDFKLMVNQDVVDKIANKGIMPTIDIAGHPFYIDLSNDKLIPKNDIWSRGIIFSELKHYKQKDQSFIIPYNNKTHTFQEVSLNAKEIPENLIIVQIPSKRNLDPIYQNKISNFNSSDFLKKNGVHLRFEAKVIAWQHTKFAETIKNNTQQAIREIQKSPKTTGKKLVGTQQINQPQNKQKSRRM